MGFQYTSVDSRARCVHPAALTQGLGFDEELLSVFLRHLGMQHFDGYPIFRDSSQDALVQPSFSPAKYIRVILLPQGMITCLQKHAARKSQERTSADDKWQPLDLVICTRDGTALSPDRLRSSMQDLLRQIQLPTLHFHELRQTTTQLLLQAGLTPQIVGEVLGIGRQVLPYRDHWASVSRAYYEPARQMMDQLFFTT